MVETIMVFALGFLAAALIALLIIPAINARAERLARRRVESQFPLSISELMAEKDHLRAEFAVLQRRVERKAKAGLATQYQSMEELGRRAVQIEALESILHARDQTIADLEQTLGNTRGELASRVQELAQVQAILADRQDALSKLEAIYQPTQAELARFQTENGQLQVSLEATSSDLTSARKDLEAQKATFTDLERQHATTLEALDTKRIIISDLETRLLAEAGHHQDLERMFQQIQSENENLRQNLSDVADQIMNSRSDNDIIVINA